MINGYDTLQGDKYITALCVNQRQLKTKTKQEFDGIYRRYFFLATRYLQQHVNKRIMIPARVIERVQ